MNRLRQLIMNGLLLTAVSLVMRGVGVSFGVYLSNRVGAEAMGLYSLITGIYAFAVTLATSGIALASVRMISEAMGKQGGACGKTPTVRRILGVCCGYGLACGIGACCLLFSLSRPIGLYLLRDERSILPLQILSLTLPSLSLCAALSGYFTATRRAYKNAVSQMAEQLLRILFCSLLLTYLFASDAEIACVCIALGGTVAEWLSLLVQWLLYAVERRQRQDTPAPRAGTLRHTLLGITLPVMLSSMLRSGLVTAEHILIPWSLERSGADRSASLAAYGVVHGMVLPVIFFPSAILSSFAGLMIPEVAEAQAAGEKARTDRICARVLALSLLFAIGTAGIMTAFSYELGTCIYPNTNAGTYIRLLAPLIPIMYADTATDALLKGLGEQVYTMKINVIDALLSVILVPLLIPFLGIMGYIVAVYVTETFNTVMSVWRLLRVTGLRPRPVQWIFLPLGAVILACTVTRYLFALLPPLPISPLRLCLHLGCAALLYLGVCAPQVRSKNQKVSA
ncbi:MAG: hypothetical protein E7664_02615 [Ruminococcaceae bacterium]|nr:hypothetical protein [Oscillospiraceae bacterium]